MNHLDNHMEDNEITIDITTLLHNAWKGLKKFGWLVIVFSIVSAGWSCYRAYRNYSPYYRATATFTVGLSSMNESSIFNDNVRAYQMSRTFPYILNSGVLRNIIAIDMGEETIAESIMADGVENTNLFTITVISWDPLRAYNVLQAVIRNYPIVAESVVGKTNLTMLDQTGIPTEPENTIAYWGSIKRGVLPGASLGMLIILLYIITRKTIHKPEDVAALSNIKHLGSLQEIKFKKRRKQINNAVYFNNHKLPPMFREHIYKIRTRVDKFAMRQSMRTIMITSTLPGEGKSTLAINLALSMAEIGKKVVLVDCDLHRPSIARILNLEDAKVGFDDVLQNKSELKDALQYHDELNISILPCLKPMENASELIGTLKMITVLSELSQNYDYVILDTSPSAILSDASKLSLYVDGVIYVIRQDYSKVSHILGSLDQLSENRVEILGYVMNGVQSSLIGYGYGYGYGSYSKYGSYGGYGHGKDTKLDELQAK